MTVRMGYDLAETSPIESEQGNAAVKLRGRDRKTTFGGSGSVIYKHKMLSTGIASIGLWPPQSGSAALRRADLSGGAPLNTPLKNGDDKMKEEKVRIRVRLTEDEKEKLEQNSE